MMSSQDEENGQEEKDDGESVDHLFIIFYYPQGELHAFVNLLFCAHRDRTTLHVDRSSQSYNQWGSNVDQ